MKPFIKNLVLKHIALVFTLKVSLGMHELSGTKSQNDGNINESNGKQMNPKCKII